jgi:hypothetical protein
VVQLCEAFHGTTDEASDFPKMSETEPLLNSDEFGNPRENKSFNHKLPVFVCLIIVFGIGVIWMVVIPNYIQKEIDTGMGYFMLDKLNISGIGNKKMYFDVKSTIQFIQDPRQVSVTAEIAKNKLDVQLSRNSSHHRSILNLGIPHFFYSTDESQLNVSFMDVVQVKNVQLLSALISDFALNNSNSYSIQFISYPIVSIPGLPGSWKLKFIRTFDFKATSNFNNLQIGTLNTNLISIKEYKMTTGKDDDGLPKVFIAANATIFNSEPISVPLIDASLTIQVFYKDHHVLNVKISDIFLNPSGITYPLPIFIETFDWTALQELIFRYSEGQDVVVNLKNFRFNTDKISELKWIEGLVYGLDFPLALPKLSGDGIFQLCRGYSKEKVYFNVLKKVGRRSMR